MRNLLLTVTGLVSMGMMLSLSTPAAAQEVDIPCSTARLIVPYSPGGGTDIIFRTFANAANEAGANPALQVVNISGQSGMKGAGEVAESEADGCTLLAHHEALITNKVSGQSELGWSDFEPVALLSYTPYVLGARGSAPFDTVPELVEAAKAAPGEVSVGVGIASTSHFLTLILEEEASIKLNNVPYDGTKEKVSALLSETIDLAALDVISSLPYLEDGSIKVLATATEERDPLIPDVPTFKEHGIDLVYGLNRGIYLPEGASAEVVDHWEKVFRAAAENPDIQAELDKFGTAVSFADSESLAAKMTRQDAAFTRIAKQIGLTE